MPYAQWLMDRAEELWQDGYCDGVSVLLALAALRCAVLYGI